jgi:hypothetical protein
MKSPNTFQNHPILSKITQFFPKSPYLSSGRNLFVFKVNFKRLFKKINWAQNIGRFLAEKTAPDTKKYRPNVEITPQSDHTANNKNATYPWWSQGDQMSSWKLCPKCIQTYFWWKSTHIFQWGKVLYKRMATFVISKRASQRKQSRYGVWSVKKVLFEKTAMRLYLKSEALACARRCRPSQLTGWWTRK